MNYGTNRVGQIQPHVWSDSVWEPGAMAQRKRTQGLRDPLFLFLLQEFDTNLQEFDT